MQTNVLIVQNITREGPGLLGNLLEESRIAHLVVDLSRGEELPAGPEAFGAIIVLGGPDSANDDTSTIRNQLCLTAAALERGIPYLGICLGLQILVKAAGGAVVKSPVKETGFVDESGEPYSVKLTEEGRADPLFTRLPSELPVFQLHGETVELTSHMTLLASGRQCPNQIVRVGRSAYGIQSHLELTEEMLATWADEDPDLAPIGQQGLLGRFKAIEDAYTRTGRTLLSNFLSLAGVSAIK